MSTPVEEVTGLTELIPGAAYQRVVAVPTPPAGQGWTVTVPGGVAWRLLMVFSILITSAVAATRYPYLSLTDGTTSLFHIPIGGSAGASGTLWCTWAVGFPITQSSLGSSGIAPLPRHILLMPGWVLMIRGLNIDSGDTFTNNSLLVVEHRLGPPPPREVFRDLPLIERW